MIILDHQTTSAVYAGIKGSAEWVLKVSQGAADWIKAKLLYAKGLLNSIQSGLAKVGDTIKGALKFLKGWFDDDPIGATAGVAAGALALAATVFVGGSLVGAIGGGGLLALLKATPLLVGGAVANFALGNPIKKAAQFIVRGVAGLYNFNWQQSDKEIWEEQQAAIRNFFVNSGGLLGQAMGAMICGVNAGFAQVEIKVKTLARVWTILDDNQKDQLLDAWTGLLQSAKMVAQRLAVTELYKNVRRWVRENIRTGYKPWDSAIANWGKEGNKAWSIQSAIEEYTESLPDKTLGATIQELADNFAESCVGELQFRVSYA